MEDEAYYTEPILFAGDVNVVKEIVLNDRNNLKLSKAFVYAGIFINVKSLSRADEEDDGEEGRKSKFLYGCRRHTQEQ